MTVVAAYLVLVARLLLALVFLTAVLNKLGGRNALREFARSLRGLRVLPPRLVPSIAVAVVTTEVAVVGLLAAPPTVTAGLALAAALLVTFAGVLTKVVRSGLRVPCHCFGTFDRPVGPLHVARNLGLAALAVAALLSYDAARSSVPVGGVVIVSLIAVLAAFFITHLDSILYRA